MIENKSTAELLYSYVKDNNVEALTLFLKKQANIIYRIIKQTLNNHSDTEDVLQTVFMIIFAKAKDNKYLDQLNDALITGWCITIARNAAKMKNREEVRRKKRESIVSAKMKKTSTAPNQSNFFKNELVEKVAKAMTDLPENYRLPIHLHYIEELELKQVASILKLNPNTLRTHLKRGLNKLSVILKKSGVVAAGTLIISSLNNLPLEAAPKEIVDNAIQVACKTTTSISSRYVATHSSTNSYLTIKLFYFMIPLFLLAFYILYTPKEGFFVKQSVTPQFNTPLKKYEWEFKNGIPKDLSMIRGDWGEVDSKEFIQFENNNSQLILLPIKKENYDIVIEAQLRPRELTKEENKIKKQIGLAFSAVIHENKKNLISNCYYSDFYTFKNQSLVNAKLYLSSDWNYSTINGKLTGINRHKGAYKGFTLITLKNYNLISIKIYEVEKLPEAIIQKATEEIKKDNISSTNILVRNIKKLELPSTK